MIFWGFGCVWGGIYRLFHPDIWLFFSRADESDGNAYALYKWAREKKKCYFIMNPHSSGFEADMIPHYSLKHYILSAAATVHAFDVVPAYNLVGERTRRIFHLKTKNVFLSHGPTRVDIPYYHYDRMRFCLFTTVGEKEACFVRQMFGYPEKNIAITGFARFDDLLENAADKKYILIMPTWHGDLKQMNPDEFKESDFYIAFQSLLKNQQFVDFLRDNGMGFRIYLHYMIKDKRDLFEIPTDIAVYNDTNSVHELLRDCSLLITDYSSVSFDAALAGKPVVYYQFRDDQYNSAESYFQYERDGFGPVVRTEEQLTAAVKSCWNNGQFEQPETYQARVDSFFAYRDVNNCQRVYDAINAL